MIYPLGAHRREHKSRWPMLMVHTGNACVQRVRLSWSASGAGRPSGVPGGGAASAYCGVWCWTWSTRATPGPNRRPARRRPGDRPVVDRGRVRAGPGGHRRPAPANCHRSRWK